MAIARIFTGRVHDKKTIAKQLNIESDIWGIKVYKDTYFLTLPKLTNYHLSDSSRSPGPRFLTRKGIQFMPDG